MYSRIVADAFLKLLGVFLGKDFGAQSESTSRETWNDKGQRRRQPGADTSGQLDFSATLIYSSQLTMSDPYSENRAKVDLNAPAVDDRGRHLNPPGMFLPVRIFFNLTTFQQCIRLAIYPRLTPLRLSQRRRFSSQIPPSPVGPKGREKKRTGAD